MTDTSGLFSGVTWLTFDCYGTLIDWERGIFDAARAAIFSNSNPIPDAAILAAYARAEAACEAGPYMPYRGVLQRCLALMAAEFDTVATEAQQSAFARSLCAWPAFGDTVDALRRLERRFRLAIVSNIDDDLFTFSEPRLGIRPALVVTAMQVGSYKPASAHFHEALRRIGEPKTHVVHVAQSRYHDIAPARALGLRTVWVNRASAVPGVGVAPPPPPDSEPDLTVRDLSALADAAGA